MCKNADIVRLIFTEMTRGQERHAEMAVGSPSLRKNSIYNIGGHLLPLVSGFLLIPHLIHNLGLERFGMMTIVWAVIGYFSLFDFGLGRTLTVKISQLQSKGDIQAINVVFWTSIKLILAITMIGSIVIWILSFQPDLLAGKTSSAATREVMASLKIMAFALPAITLTAGIKGALEADHQFLNLNILQTFLGVLNFLVPYLISIQHPHLHLIVGALTILRYAFCIFHFLLLHRTSTWIQRPHFLKFNESLPLLSSGGWFTVTNIVGPLMLYFDRFFLALLIPSVQLSYYTTPFEIVNRLLILPSSITRALFPVLAASKTDFQSAQIAYRKSFQTITILCVGIAILGILGSRWGLQIWLGTDFAESSYQVLIVLLLGFAANAMAWCPFHLIQALNRPDLSAKVHLIELPFYCATLYFLAINYGIKGAALAWALRNLVDLVVMFLISEKLRKKLWKMI